MYNLDEMRMAIGIIEASYIVIDKSIMSKYQGQSERQEWITVLECIYDDGSVIPSTVIFKE